MLILKEPDGKFLNIFLDHFSSEKKGRFNQVLYPSQKISFTGTI